MSWLKCAFLLWGAACTGCGVSGPRLALSASWPFAPPNPERPAIFSSRPLPGCLLEERPAFVHARTLASTFRALEFKKNPPLRALSEHEVWPFLRSHLDLVQIKRTQRIYAALGLLPLGFDLELVLLRVLQEQFLGAYDAAHQVIFLRKKHVPSLREPLSLSEHRNLKALLVHEYVHALQDQYFGIGGSASLLASLDQARAWEALLEGDALFCSLAAVGTNPMEFQISFFDSSNLDASFSGIPEFLRETLLFPYVHGLSFVIAVRNGRVFHGLRGVAALNHAFMGLPLSTSTVLHHSPRPSLHHAFSFRSLIEDHGCEVLEEDTLGEFEIRVFLEWLFQHRTEEVSNGWEWDRIVVFRCASGEALSFAWMIWWADIRRAEEIGRALSLKQKGSKFLEIAHKPHALLLGARVPQPLWTNLHRRLLSLDLP